MSPVRYLISLTCCALITLSFSYGQVKTGTPPFASFAGGPFDIVNLGNVNVHFAVPILNKNGRGMPFTYSLGYDNSVWSPAVVNGVRQWQPAFNWGWVAQTAVTTGYISYSKTTQRCDLPPPQTGTYSIWSNFVYHDPWGGYHAFDGQLETDPLNCDLGNTLSMSSAAADGSGYTLSANTSGQDTITTKDGLILKPPLNANGSAASTLTDRNGNQISVSASGVFTDTLGTTVLTIAGQGTATSPLDLQYTGPNGLRHVYVYYTNYNVKTNFGCGFMEYGGTSGIQNPLVDHITFPDGSTYAFAYETTLGSGNSGYVTGRLQSVVLPTGGKISYTYIGGTYVANTTNGITCADGSTATLQRTVDPNPGGTNDDPGTWQYARSLVSGTQWITTITDPTPQQNQAVLNFQGIYETERKIYQGTAGGNPYRDVVTCYNGTAPTGTPATCNASTITLPIGEVKTTTTLPGGQKATVDTTYLAAGLPLLITETGYNTLGRTTTISYAALGNGIYDKPATVQVNLGTGGLLSKTVYTYDEPNTLTSTTGTPQHASISGSRGNPTTIANAVSANGSTTTYLTRHATYYDTGNVNTTTDYNGAVTTFKYNTLVSGKPCANSLLIEIDLALGFKRYLTWDTPDRSSAPNNCDGAVVLSSTDENGNTTSTGFADANYWRSTSTTDELLNQTAITYPNLNSVESTLTFGSSVSNSRVTVDGFGRPHVAQKLQGPSPVSTYDSIETDYDVAGRPYFNSIPYSASAGQTCAPPANCSGTTTAFDAFGRISKVTDAGGGDVAYNFDPSTNDVVVALEPPPGVEHTKQRQMEYDALGNLSSVCEMTSASDGGSCAQNSSGTGYWTQYTYWGNQLVYVNQGTQSTHPQSRSFIPDMLGRIVSETTPEAGLTQYFYDSDTGSVGSPCPGTYSGDLVKKYDAKGNTTCYAYDPLHRVTSITYSGPYASVTPNKYFIYDSATLNSTSMANAKGRLAEAYTGSSGSRITDLFFSYSVRGEIADVYEKTPNSGGYYHVTSTYLANGNLSSIQALTGLPAITYTPDPEGRVLTVSAGGGTPLVASPGTSYDVAGNVLKIPLGSGDSDSFTYDNTGRMTKYTFKVGSQSVVGQLQWNLNGTLGSLTVTDPFNSQNQQSCNYFYDDLGRLAGREPNTNLSVHCENTWQQTFTMDAFGNLSKSGNSSFVASYLLPDGSTNNQIQSISGFVPGYDTNGNLLTDTLHNYTWDAVGKAVSVGTSGSIVTVTYDALGRMVEQARGTSYTQIVYGPLGFKLALMNGPNLNKAFVPLPAGAQAVYGPSGLSYYRHPDWLGSSRFASTSSSTKYFDVAYAPYGEDYADSGTNDLVFTGENADTVTAYPSYDFLLREYSPGEGRWVSPDPAGLTAVSPENPQSWNRYAYAENSPCQSVDPTGLATCTLQVNLISPLGDKATQELENRISQTVGAVTTPSGDSVAVQFSAFTPGAVDLAIFNRSGADYGETLTFAGIPILSWVNYKTVQQTWGQNSVVAAGTVAAHEIFHQVTGTPDLPYNGNVNLMTVNDATKDPTMALLATIDYGSSSVPGPFGFNSFTQEQMLSLYNACLKQQRRRGGGGGWSNPGTSDWTWGFWTDWNGEEGGPGYAFWGLWYTPHPHPFYPL